MGLLSQGAPLDWDETKKYAKFVQARGIAQFINIYNESKDRADGPFKWGDEVEYILVKFDHKAKRARVSLKAEEVFQRLAEQQKIDSARGGGPAKSIWHPEFAAYMIEGTPSVPYGVDGQLLTSLCDMEDNMQARRHEVQRVLGSDESVMSITSFPRLGCANFTHPAAIPRPQLSASGSLFFPDEAIYGGHPRFKTLVKNIRSRRKRKVIINLPIFRDKLTPNPYNEYYDNDQEARDAVKPNHVYMDAMGFGMGCCCLQITYQATHLKEARVLYDQLVPLTPIALALSAASPIFRGLLTDRDCRWDVIACSVDDRTREESGELSRRRVHSKETCCRIPKSRYDSVSCYLSPEGQSYNDLKLIYDKNYYDVMVANNVEPAIARHMAHLFIRDPITLYKEKMDQTDDELDHFENIQSTNWQTVRFKPPPSVHSPIGWRVEFRPLEAQTSDFENAAFSVFITLLTRVVLLCKLNFLIPLSLVDENMVEAQKRDAVRESKFWFRTNVMHRNNCMRPLSTVPENCCNFSNNRTTNSTSNLSSINHQAQPALTRTERLRDTRTRSASAAAARSVPYANSTINNINNATTNGTTNNHVPNEAIENCAAKMTIDEIINGREDFVGLMPMVWHYVESLEDGSNTEYILKIKRYLQFISDRASLKVKTTARQMRDFVQAHPKYGHDSVVNDEVAYDLLMMMDKIGKTELDYTGQPQPNSSGNCHL